MFTRLVEPGIELRQFEMRDADIVFAAVERNRAYLREWLPWVDMTHSADDIRNFIGRAITQFQDGLGPNCGIWLDGVYAGNVGCHPIDRPHRSVSIGYWLDARLQGRGILTRCCRYLVNYLFSECGLHRVEIRCATGNTKSCAIPPRLGFAMEGILHDAEWVNDRFLDLKVWGMLEQNWKY